LFSVLILNRMEPIDDFIWDVHLRDCRRLIDDPGSVVSVVVGLPFKNT
jgi:hypothetical protein